MGLAVLEKLREACPGIANRSDLTMLQSTVQYAVEDKP